MKKMERDWLDDDSDVDLENEEFVSLVGQSVFVQVATDDQEHPQKNSARTKSMHEHHHGSEQEQQSKHIREQQGHDQDQQLNNGQLDDHSKQGEEDFHFHEKEDDKVKKVRGATSPPPSPPPPPPPPPLVVEEENIGKMTCKSPEETPIKRQLKSFEELLEEKVPVKVEAASPTPVTAEKSRTESGNMKFSFLKKNSRNWNRIDAVKHTAKKQPPKPKITSPSMMPPTQVYVSQRQYGDEDESLDEFEQIERQVNDEHENRGCDDDNDDDDDDDDSDDEQTYGNKFSFIGKPEQMKQIDRPTKQTSALVQKMFRTLDPSHNTDRDRENQSSPSTAAAVITPKTEDPDISNELTGKLMKEMENFKKANEELQKSLKMLENDRKQLERERLELNQAKREKTQETEKRLNEMQETLRKERAQLRKEREGLDRQKEHIELLRATTKLERKDKSQVDSLQATILQLRQAEQERITKHKDAMKAKRERIKTLETQVNELEEALRFAEQRRLDAWSKQTASEKQLEQLRDQFAAFEAKFLDQEKLIKELTTENQAHERKNEAREPEQRHQSPKSRVDDAKTSQKTSTKSKRSRTKKYSKESLPTGETVITFANGDVKTLIPAEGVEIYHYAASNTKKTKYADGMVLLEFANGQVERTLPNGVLEVFYVDGTIKTIQPDNSQETLFPDGLKVTQLADGQILQSQNEE